MRHNIPVCQSNSIGIVTVQRLLVVEDDKDLNAAYQLILRREKHTVESAFDGNEALTKLKTFQPDLILLDLCMPGEDGKQVLARLRTDPLTRTIPVILLTGADVSSVRQRTSPHHPDAFLAKPLNFEELLEKIRAHIEIR